MCPSPILGNCQVLLSTCGSRNSPAPAFCRGQSWRISDVVVSSNLGNRDFKFLGPRNVESCGGACVKPNRTCCEIELAGDAKCACFYLWINSPVSAVELQFYSSGTFFSHSVSPSVASLTSTWIRVVFGLLVKSVLFLSGWSLVRCRLVFNPYCCLLRHFELQRTGQTLHQAVLSWAQCKSTEKTFWLV